MDKLIKLICKKTGKEVTSFTVLTENMAYRRDWQIVGRGTVMIEYDKEYFSGQETSLCYSVEGQNDSIEYPLTKNLIDKSHFLSMVIVDHTKFDITNDMIEESVKIGPFLIQRVNQSNDSDLKICDDDVHNLLNQINRCAKSIGNQYGLPLENIGFENIVYDWLDKHSMNREK